MQTLFVVCAVFGGGILVVQLVLGVAGFDGAASHDVDHHDHAGPHVSDSLHLRSARAIGAGLTFFGLGGLLGVQLGLGAWLSLPIGLVLGAAAQIGTAVVLKAIGRLDQDRTLALDRAIGQIGRVYLAVPADGHGAGKVHVSVQERLIECPAISRHEAIPTGAAVLVVDIADERAGTLVVVPNPPLLEESNAVV